ncbi:MAG: uracil-DNA glycosylase [Phycisphaerales bacterium]|nr:uracil-DNA glycosylase [Phycisphaerales bacterium]
MNASESASVRRAIIQHLETDRQLGVRSVPILLPGASRVSRASTEDRAVRLAALNEGFVRDCRKCALCETRTQTVFGSGNAAARVVFVGEAPGADEDRQGVPFVGRAGQLLTKMIGAMGLDRKGVFICNVLKCRPPDNRTPAADEVAACSPYLLEQISIIEPEVIVALGSPAVKTLLSTTESISRLRGKFHDFYPSGTPTVGPVIPLMPTFHPAYLLRSPDEKGKAWSDLQMVMKLLGLPPRTS